MEKVVINNQTVEYTLKRSNRKSIAIEIGVDGAMVVRAPKNVSMQKVEELLEKKKEWILGNLAKYVKESGHDANQVYYLGNRMRVCVMEHKSNLLSIERKENELVIWKPAGFSLNKQAFLENWYRKQAGRVIAEKVAFYSKRMHVTYENITIKDQKTRWGSCSSKGNLNFNYRLIMAPERVLEYVVVHELAHRIHMDHSKAFWNEVAAIVPEYSTYRLWLKEHGHQLRL